MIRLLVGAAALLLGFVLLVKVVTDPAEQPGLGLASGALVSAGVILIVRGTRER